MNIGIIGLGLMGSSMAMALKKYCAVNLSIYGHDKNVSNLNYMLKNNFVDKILNESNYSTIDILFLAIPVRRTIKVISDISPYLNTDKILITDMGSTKFYICEEIDRKFPFIDFVGGHPMTGRETSGPGAALPDLFNNMTYILMDKFKDTKNQKGLLNKKLDNLLQLLNKIGAKLIFMNSEIHDEIVAMTSHLPHFIAASIINETSELEKEYPQISKLMGQGYKDFTRIAASSPEIWRDIFITNRKYIVEQIDKMMKQMIILKDAIAKKDEEKLFNLLLSAQKKRKFLNREFEKVSKDGY